MNKIKCEKRKHKIQKVDCGTLYCAKTKPIRKVNVRAGDFFPTWCPENKKEKKNAKKLSIHN